MAPAPVTRTLVVSTGSSAVCMTGAAVAGGCAAPNVIREIEVARTWEWAMDGSASASMGAGGVAFWRRQASARSGLQSLHGVLVDPQLPRHGGQLSLEIVPFSLDFT